MEKIIFTNPDTKEETEFFCLEQTKMNGWNYLLVTEEEEGEAEAYILKETRETQGESTYVMVVDEVEFNAVGKIFEELMEEDVDFRM